MARKTLLNESEIRRFMKLANMKPVGEQRLAEMGGYMSAKRDDEDEEPGMRDDMMEQEEEEMDMEMDMEEKPAEDPMDEPEMDDMDMDKPEMDPMTPADEEDAAADAIMEALSGISYQPSQSEIVNEVAQRVARRLQAAKLHEAKLNKALGRK